MTHCANSPTTEALRREIDRFMQAAVKHGQSDLYQNRRSSLRYHRSWPLLVAAVEMPEMDDLSVTLSDVSADGVGFFCDRSLPEGMLLGVKLFWMDPNSPRVPAIVRHQQITQQGFLVGAQFLFDDPTARDMIRRHATGSWYG